jgi:pilus assembly protein CpaE
MAQSNLAEALGGRAEPEIAGCEHAIPRISIAAFCNDAELSSVLQSAGADRRLAKTHFSLHQGGAREAAAHFAQNTTPDLLLVETVSQADAVLSELEELAQVCDASTKAIVIGRNNDVQLYRKLMHSGISEYLLAPVTPLQIIEAISHLYADKSSLPLGKLVVFAAARGGAGSSTLAHNLAWSVANTLNIHTALIDVDLAFGTVGLDFNQEPSPGVAEALAAPDRIDEVLLERLLLKCGEYLSLLTAPASLEQDHVFEPDAVETLINRARAMVPCVVVDLPHAWNSWTSHILRHADEIVIVATPDLASLRNCKNLLTMARSRRANDSPPRLVINQAGIPKRKEVPVKEFATTVGQEPELVLNFDPPLFGLAANNGQMLAEVQPKSRAADAMRQLAKTVTGKQAKSPAKSGGLSLAVLGLKSG